MIQVGQVVTTKHGQMRVTATQPYVGGNPLACQVQLEKVGGRGGKFHGSYSQGTVKCVGRVRA